MWLFVNYFAKSKQVHMETKKKKSVNHQERN
jgi:hypothetical protein